jgi:hypothetical protein
MTKRYLGLDLPELENVVLSIMAQGEDMLPIGSWEAPIESLAVKGLISKVGGGYRITDAGRAVWAQAEDAELRGMIGEHNSRVRENGPVIEGTAEEDPCQ